MNERPGHWTSIALITLALLLICGASPAQERVSISYSTLEAQNADFLSPRKEGCIKSIVSMRTLFLFLAPRRS